MADLKPLQALAIGLFILVATAGTTYLITDDDSAYLCEDREIVGLCFKLSAENSDGFQTRCYYNESAPTRYKTCKSGWVPYANPDVTGKPIVIEDGIDEKIELINGEYYRYELKEVFTNQSISIEISQLIKEKDNLELLINNLEEDCSYCAYEKTKGCVVDCLKDGSWITASEKIYFNQTIKDKEEELWNLENLI